MKNFNKLSRLFLAMMLILTTAANGYCLSKTINGKIEGKLQTACPQDETLQCPASKPKHHKRFFNSDEAAIKKLFEKQTEYLNASNIEGLKQIYSDQYISNDGFNKETLFKLYTDTLKNHPDIKYDVLITRLNVSGNYATAKATNKSIATTAEKSAVTGDKGILTIDMETIFNLKKTGQEWQIISEETTSEKTSLLYGDCKYARIQLAAPEYVQANTDYTTSLKMPEEYAKFAMGSIKKELIIYPAEDSQDLFKNFDNIGLIERIFKSNDSGNNETIAASVAFALPKLDKDRTINVKISGLAILLQRVNVIKAPKS